jgi:hypothetical protein
MKTPSGTKSDAYSWLAHDESAAWYLATSAWMSSRSCAVSVDVCKAAAALERSETTHNTPATLESDIDIPFLRDPPVNGVKSNLKLTATCSLPFTTIW